MKKRVMIFGASGGIGSALCTVLTADRAIECVYAGGRIASRVPQGDRIRPFSFDYGEEASIQQAIEAATIDGPLDAILVATGVLEDDVIAKAEKSTRDLDPDMMAHYFLINTIGPSLVAKHGIKHLRKDHVSIFAALSARVGSIGDNQLGGWYGYRASKAALNMMIKSLAIETTRRYAQAVIIGLHPGTVDTGLSKRYQKNMKHELFTPEQSAAYLYEVLKTRTPQDTGQIFAWDGQVITP